MASSHFRAGVVIVVMHPDSLRVMAFERADSPEHWQLPQGGLRAGETPLDGAWRELGEETGLGPEEVEIHREFPDWLTYEWPDDVRADKGGPCNRIGQVQKWFIGEARSGDVEPEPDGNEFLAWRWVEPAWLVEHVPPWRRGPYERVLGGLRRG
jgi:putative (di)nucleoside polyphosphate hydrolase